MRTVALFCLTFVAALPLQAGESCMTIHGRASFASGDSQLRIWHIGTHHEYGPDESSWDTVMGWLEAGIKGSDKSNYVSPASAMFVFGDFLVCPTEPFKKGSVRQAKISRHYVRVN
jgi:hypothetical protein